MNTAPKDTHNLPIRRSLTFSYMLSLIIAILMAAASAVGLTSQATLYPTEELRLAFVPNDAANLLIGLPILLISVWLARRGQLAGLLLWPGALYFTFYSYFIYIFSVPLTMGFLLQLSLVMLSVYALIDLLTNIDGQWVHQQLSGKVPERFAGGVLAGLSGLFLIRVVVILINAVTSGTSMGAAELGLNIADFLLTPAWIIGGVLLWRRTNLGYVTGLGLLFQASMLFIGLIFVFIVQPFIAPVPFALVDTLVILVMSLITIIPFARFLRAAAAVPDRSTS